MAMVLRNHKHYIHLHNINHLPTCHHSHAVRVAGLHIYTNVSPTSHQRHHFYFYFYEQCLRHN